MKPIVDISFNSVYKKLIDELFSKGEESVSRKGKKLTELHDAIFTIKDPGRCMAICRDMSTHYLSEEFHFYMSGSNLLADAVKCSKFWENCTDDGETVNSNYGKLLFHDKNTHGVTQFEHAANCLRNSKGSKKAVMTIYNNENAYISNDNPCTMFLKARIDNEDKLHLTAVMRSSDIYYGLPYDVPFFCFVQRALIEVLRHDYPCLSLGTYTHFANSLHFYEYKREELEKALLSGQTIDQHQLAEDFYYDLAMKYIPVVNSLLKPDFMERAWKEAQKSNCLKKKVGCVMTIKHDNKAEEIISYGYGDVAEHREPCKTCARDDENDRWFETGCPSVHAEHRALDKLRKAGISPDFSKVKVYVTHGPCDACLKMLDLIGVREVEYDIPYKTNYSHWPNICVHQCSKPSNREPGKS
jgi:thymidylate synthase